MAKPLVDIRVSDVNLLNQALTAIGGKDARSAARSASTKSHQITLKKARALAPRDTGLLSESLIKKSKTYKRDGVILNMIGPDSKAEGRHPDTGKLMKPIKYAHIVEKLKPFLGPAQRSTSNQVISAFSKFAWINIQKFVNKRAKKARV